MGFLQDFFTNPLGALSDAVTDILQPIEKEIAKAISGLFSSTTRTSVGTTVSRVVKDDVIIASTKLGLVAGLLRDDGNQLVENVLESLVSGIGVRTERMYNYAKNSYTHGLPSAKVVTSIDGSAAVFNVLQSLTNNNISFEYYHVGPLNNLHAAWWTLTNTMGYDSRTNKIDGLGTYSGYEVYLKDIVILIKEATLTERTNGSLEQWGVAASAGYTPERTNTYLASFNKPTPFMVDSTIQSDFARITYVWEVPTVTVISPTSSETKLVLHEKSVDIPLAAFELSGDYFHIKYSDAGKAGYWLYQWGSGKHPTIDALFGVTSGAPAEFLPSVYFRNAHVNLKDNEGFKSSTKMLKFLGIDYQQMLDAIHENPDIEQIEQAKLVFAVPANTTNPVEQKYLFDFFNKLRLAAGGFSQTGTWDISSISAENQQLTQNSVPVTLLDFNTNQTNLINARARIAISIEDKLSSTGLSCQGIFRRTVAGVVAAVDAYTSSFTTHAVDFSYTKDGQLQTLHNPMDAFIYRHQITESVYEELTVYDLQMTYHVFGDYYTVGNDLDAILLVPLDHAITKNYSIPDRELLYSRSLHFVFSSKVTQKVEWYQQSWVGDLIKVVGIVLIVISLGSQTGPVASLVSYLAGYTSLTTLAVSILYTIAITLVVVEVSKIFVRSLGAEAGFIASLLLTVYAFGKGMTSGPTQNVPWAEQLLALANGLSAEVDNVMARAMQGLREEANAFNLLVKEQTELLEKETKLLEQNSPILSPKIIFGQTPTEFYNMTVHSGNIGILGIDSIASYATIALTLPKLNATIGSNEYDAI